LSRRVELVPHNPGWRQLAYEEAQVLRKSVGGIFLAIHHIGSTAVPSIRAKPVIDLMAEVANLDLLDENQAAIESAGYEWRGENGVPARRYCIKNDPQSGIRLVHLHCFERGNAEIDRHLGFRDLLRSNPRIVRAYEAEKHRCKELHPDDSNAYSSCKSEWIQNVERGAGFVKNRVARPLASW